jgi:cytochrome oxidase assembly protein ShyY1
VLRLLARPRWVALIVAVALLAAACVSLGRWQLRRLDGRRAANAAVLAGLHAPPESPDRLLRPGLPMPDSAEWRPVRTTGRYDAAYELLVRNRLLDGRVGYYVLTPLVTDSGTALLVNRGWVASGATAAARPDVPPPPPGEIEVTGRVRRSERASGHRGLPAGQVDRIDVPAIATGLPYPVYGGYAELTEQQPAAGPAGVPRPVPAPSLSEGPHLVYALQWFAFALMAIGGAVVLFRRELIEQREGQQRGADQPQVAIDIN